MKPMRIAVLVAVGQGKQIGKATLRCYRTEENHSEPALYLSIVMEHVLIANYSISGGPGNLPVENVSLDYGTIQYEYIRR